MIRLSRSETSSPDRADDGTGAGPALERHPGTPWRAVVARRVRPQGAGVAFGAADGPGWTASCAEATWTGTIAARAKRREQALEGADQGFEGHGLASVGCGGLGTGFRRSPVDEDVVAGEGDGRLAASRRFAGLPLGGLGQVGRGPELGHIEWPAKVRGVDPRDDGSPVGAGIGGVRCDAQALTAQAVEHVFCRGRDRARCGFGVTRGAGVEAVGDGTAGGVRACRGEDAGENERDGQRDARSRPPKSDMGHGAASVAAVRCGADLYRSTGHRAAGGQASRRSRTGANASIEARSIGSMTSWTCPIPSRAYARRTSAMYSGSPSSGGGAAAA